MNAQIRQEAAEWLIDFRADDADTTTRERFAKWLRTSPEHVRAYLELVAFWEDAGLYDPDRKLDMDSLIALARAQTNVVVLEAAPGEDCVAVTSSPQTTRSPVIHRRRRLAVAAAAAAAVVCVMVAIGGWSALYHDPSYATDVGEQRTVRLSDGSTVELNAVSRIRVRFSQHERAVDLLLGQALFRVAKNKDRPFLVFSGATRVRAVGTQFDVNRERSSTVVTVLEGRVAVVPQRDSTLDSALPHPAAPPIEIAAGEQLTVLPSASPRKQRANVAVTTAWTQQQLIFESTALSKVAEEFNRFNTRRLVIEDAKLADFHVSGTFPALDPASLPRFVRFLRNQPGIQVRESDERIVITQK